MKKFKKGDKVILHPPGNLNPRYNPLMGKRATVMDDGQQTDDLEWYQLEMSGGVMIKAPAKWLKKKTD